MAGSGLTVVRKAMDLGAARTGGPLSPVEAGLVALASDLPPTGSAVKRQLREALSQGEDPLGDELCGQRLARERRSRGIFYTGRELIAPMVAWALGHGPDRVVDVGCGSGRFSAAAARAGASSVVAVDTDPVATLACRAALRVAGARRVRVVNADFTRVTLPRIAGRTAFIGNPPYVRHHDLLPEHKQRAQELAADVGVELSGLAGLHVHFFLATAALARSGDVGCLVTSAEWLDVNYGRAVRQLVAGRLGGHSVHVLDPRKAAFADAMTTTAITCFVAGSEPTTVMLRSVEAAPDLGDLGDVSARPGSRSVPRAALVAADKWSRAGVEPASAHAASPDGEGPTTLKDIARVHRGTATGGNKFFVMSREKARERGLLAWCRPVIKSAKRILDSGGQLRNSDATPVILWLPRDLDRSGEPAVDQYLSEGEQMGVDRGYLCRHRTPWWWLGDAEPAPIIATYMARQPPMFATNPDGLMALNIAHGIYPRETMSDGELERLVGALNAQRETFAGAGRTYHGGLEKFEPREMEKLPIPASGYRQSIPPLHPDA